MYRVASNLEKSGKLEKVGEKSRNFAKWSEILNAEKVG